MVIILRREPTSPTTVRAAPCPRLVANPPSNSAWPHQERHEARDPRWETIRPLDTGPLPMPTANLAMQSTSPRLCQGHNMGWTQQNSTRSIPWTVMSDPGRVLMAEMGSHPLPCALASPQPATLPDLGDVGWKPGVETQVPVPPVSSNRQSSTRPRSGSPWKSPAAVH